MHAYIHYQISKRYKEVASKHNTLLRCNVSQDRQPPLIRWFSHTRSVVTITLPHHHPPPLPTPIHSLTFNLHFCYPLDTTDHLDTIPHQPPSPATLLSTQATIVWQRIWVPTQFSSHVLPVQYYFKMYTF